MNEKILLNESVYQGLDDICYYSIENADKMKKISESFEDLFPFYKNSSPLVLEEKPIGELKKFWSDVSSAAEYHLDKDQKTILFRDRGSPFVFLSNLLVTAYDNGKNELADKYLEPLWVKVKDL